MSFIPYSCQNIDDDDIAAVTAVMRSEYLTQGPVIPALEAAFGNQPPLMTAAADALGFAHDGDLSALVASALATIERVAA